MNKQFFTLALLALSFTAQAADSGDEVIIVYNTRVAESKGVAEHYAALRHVPASQIFGFALATTEDIQRTEFHDALQQPLAKALEAKKLWHVTSRIVPAAANQPAQVEWRPIYSKIRYAVLCYGVPVRIEEQANLKEEGMENLRPEMRRNVAAVDSELALLPCFEQKLPLSGPLRNWTYGATNTAFLHPTNGVLLVSRLDGPSAAIARGLVDKALAAEKDGLWGRAYFDLRNTTEPGYKVGDDWIRTAAEICHHLGFETNMDENAATYPDSFPMSQIAIYIGWYAEHACGPFAQPSVEFMPGAFAYHLHSFSASTIRSRTERWVGPLLAKGATITMGCVDEPYLTGTPDLAAFTSRLLYHGFSFGEAAYACQSVLSWQTTVVGDPLYRPFGGNPEELHQDLIRRHSKSLEWSYLRLVNLNLVAGKPASELVALLEQLENTKQSAVLSEKLGDLYAAQGKPSSCAHAWMQALKLDPSPQQRVRVTLELGEKLLALEREPEAYEYYQALLVNCPDYPEKLMLTKKLLALAQKLNKKADADKYEAEIKTLSAMNK